MLNTIFNRRFLDSLKTGSSLDIYNVHPDLAELYVAAVAQVCDKNIIWIVGENESLRDRETDMLGWLDMLGECSFSLQSHLLPVEDPYSNNRMDPICVERKARLISTLMRNEKVIILTSLAALQVPLEKKALWPDLVFHVSAGQDMSRDRLIEALLALNYQANNMVEKQGDISWRGGIVDVFPIDRREPIRIEIEADRVVSLRQFDPDSQVSIREIDAHEFWHGRYFQTFQSWDEYAVQRSPDLVPLTDLVGNYALVYSDFNRVEEEYLKLKVNFERIYNLVKNHRENIPSVPELFPSGHPKGLKYNLCGAFDTVGADVELEKLPKYVFEYTLEDFSTLQDEQTSGRFSLHVFCGDQKICDNLRTHLPPFTAHPFHIPVSFRNPQTGAHFLSFRPFSLEMDTQNTIPSSQEWLRKKIDVNDLVVHKTHGVGRFIGFRALAVDGDDSEFLKIEYQNREFLYVPVYELDVLNRYHSFEGYQPKLDKLGGGSWQIKQNRARKSVVRFARDLLELYAMRKSIRGASYSRDDELESRLDMEWQYLETEDQKRAIRETLSDLEQHFPMDRLICGDVSFGKTEVALRAAFRVVVNGKQVVLLCPTTVLAYQHFQTFKKRLANFPVRIRMYSRLVPAAERRKTAADSGKGLIDILIGTHALISGPLTFKNLGLYIVDEEQRFGVFQKEKIKKHREDIEVLSLSATPIPRTLSLSLAGLQDISVIRTPPLGRVAIKNYVSFFSKEIIISAVLKEVERDGLIFIVYNNIDKIFSFERELKSWLPDVSCNVIHARMKSETIEQNLLDFIHKKFRILLSTTIIENGIDIPDVNTLIVVDADRFGLTQLYQLRGRIGRGSRQAYAYFLVRKQLITDKARSRLQAIRDFSELGSGYKLAEFDLQLRGAGTLLGNRQHGHIEALGFDYYHQLLVKTIQELKGERVTGREMALTVQFPYAINRDYIPSATERVSFYRRLLEADGSTTLQALKREIEDRYGPLHDSVQKVFYAATVRLCAGNLSLDAVDVALNKVVFTSAAGTRSWQALAPLKKKFSWQQPDNTRLMFSFPDYRHFLDEILRLLENLVHVDGTQ